MGWSFAASIAAAVVAGIFALLAGRSSRRATRIERLEERLAGKKYEFYKPLLDQFAEMLKPGAKPNGPLLIDRMSEATTWLSVYGSDEAVLAFHRFMQCTYVSPPVPVFMRAYADLVMAARRDLSGGTETTLVELMGIRLKDVYTNDQMRAALEAPSIDAAAELIGWKTPWS